MFWNNGLKLVARCWYSGWNLIVLGMKYVACRLLLVVGCVCIIFGIGPGLASISPHCSRKR